MMEDITIIIKTFERPHELKQCIESIRNFYDIKIYVADDSLEYNDINVDKYFKLDFDVGVSFGRNFLVEQVETPYVLVIDDDSIFTEKTNINELLQVIKLDFDIVAGVCNNKNNYGCFTITDKLYIEFNKNKGMFNGYPLYDYVPQFFLAKTNILKKIKWDNELKTFDHIYFFYKCKLLNIKCTCLDNVSFINTMARNPKYNFYRLKRRGYYITLAYKKMGVKCKIIV